MAYAGSLASCKAAANITIDATSSKGIKTNFFIVYRQNLLDKISIKLIDKFSDNQVVNN